MKKSSSIKLANATLEVNENGDYIVTETKKDDELTYNFSNILAEFVGVENISIQLGKTEDIESEEV